MRIGVFVCHCGTNIAGTVDVADVAQRALALKDVVHAENIMYTCAEPGQAAIQKAIQEKKLDRVVVAACSPHMHEMTFRRCVDSGGLNPYLFEMANIREHCSWIHTDMPVATEKAWDIVKMAVAKARRLEPLWSNEVEVNKDVLVIGGGVAGIQAALDLADAGLKVTIVEKETTIGGVMAKLDKTFPTIDCSACILTPRMVDCAQHENIDLMAYCEVDKVSGYVGNFTVDIRKKAAMVDWTKCIGCEICVQKCPSKAPDSFNVGLEPTKAIYIPFPQAVPKRAAIQIEHCRYFTQGKCRVCERVCPADAIDYEQKEEIVQKRFGAIVVATGLDVFPWEERYHEYGSGKIKDVISGLQYERMLNASGPHGGHVHRLSNGEDPKTVVFIQCVGSRDESVGRPYCSSVCCMYTAKQALLTKDHCGMDTEVYVFYIDIRATGKGYEEFIKRVQTEFGVKYVRGRVSKLYEENGKVMVRGTDTLLGEQVEIAADLVVLASGITSSPGVVRAGPEAQYQLRRVRLPQRRPPEAAPGRDQHRRRLPGRRLPGAQGHPGHGGSGLGYGVQGHRPSGQGQAQDQSHDRHRGTEGLRLLLEVHRGVSVQRSGEAGSAPGRVQEPRDRDGLPGVRRVCRQLPGELHLAQGLPHRRDPRPDRGSPPRIERR